jgi:hypothetical protein
MIYEGGSLDGKIADLPTRALSSVVIGLHRGNWHFFETYKRTIDVNFRNRRTKSELEGSSHKKCGVHNETLPVVAMRVSNPVFHAETNVNRTYREAMLSLCRK